MGRTETAQGRLAVILAAVVLLAIGAAGVVRGLRPGEKVGTEQDPTVATTFPAQEAEDKAAGIAQDQVREAEVAIETYATANGGLYVGATAAGLVAIDPGLESANGLAVTPDSTGQSYFVDVTTPGGTIFRIGRTNTGELSYRCNPPGMPGCSQNGRWN